MSATEPTVQPQDQQQPAAAAPAVEEKVQPKMVLPENAMVVIVGFRKCRNYIRAASTYDLLDQAKPNVVRVTKVDSDRDGFHALRPRYLEELGMAADDHKTSPLVFIADSTTMKPLTYIGGASDFCDIVKAQFDVEPAVLGPKLE